MGEQGVVFYQRRVKRIFIEPQISKEKCTGDSAEEWI